MSVQPSGSPGSLTTIVDEVGAPVSFSSTAPDQWIPIAENEIAVSDTYQVLFPAGSALRGGYITNTSPPGTPPIWVDVTGATGTNRSVAAMPIYPAISADGAPGAWRVPACKGPVTIMGPQGSTFGGFSA
jgi:hypothetical protein